jgi:hypothetical protein
MAMGVLTQSSQDRELPRGVCFQVIVIGHGLMLSLSITKWCNLLDSQSPVYVGEEQTKPDLLNLLSEGIDSDVWLMCHKSILAFPHRNADRISFGSKKILLEEFVD